MSKAEIRRRRVGPLECFEVLRDPQGPYVVMMHGFGADFQDLLPLHQVVTTSKTTNWLFPNAPLTVPLGPHMQGRAWFPISLAAMEQAAQGTPLDLTAVRPPGLESSRRKVMDMLEALKVPLSRVVLSGFSQGAMLATDVTLHSSERVAGLAILSGTLIDRETWKQKIENYKGLPFFQSHGEADPVLSVEGARQLERLLVQGGCLGKLQVFRGQHEIPPEVLIQLGGFLRSRI